MRKLTHHNIGTDTDTATRHGFFNFSQKALPLLLDSVSTSPYPPTLLITGATASVRGSARFGDFAAGKFAVRALGQSLAREFGPKGVHVAHAVVDGVIDIPRTKGFQVNGGGPDSKIDPDAIAESYWYLHTQPRSSFTQELDVRPYVEKF
jgi:NAD(P)-dependent dehydrogenase (short-subunit alcohol dehydrogenase family)